MANIDTVRRDFEHPRDVAALTRFAARIWTPDSRFHVGDLAWEIGSRPNGDAPRPMSVWTVDDALVAWARLAPPNHLDLIIDPARPELIDDILAWATQAKTPVVTIQDSETPLAEALRVRGYTADLDGIFFLAHRRELTDLPTPDLPEGYTVRVVRGEADITRRVAVHTEAWHPSTFGEANYRALIATWPYRPEFDVIVRAPDGRFVSSTLGWYDEANRVGLFEPVGTAPDHRRRGLSRATGLAVLRAFRAAGGLTAQVYARGDDAYPVPKQVYQDLGFVPYARTVRYAR